MNSLNTGVIKSVEMDFGFMLGFYSGELVHYTRTLLENTAKTRYCILVLHAL